ncbi:hypothetical protein [Chryseobacterium hispalense]|uniref:hypothetical protein n=1 Tax=Chryseobacterium hispalense TaxID=1453492 RepID=UPI00391D1D53
MKNKIKYILFLAINLILVNCKTLKENTIVGEWKLSGQFVDENPYASYSEPKVQKIISERRVKFNSDKNFQSNADICVSGTDTLSITTGKFIKYKNKDGYYILQPDKCIGISGSNILMRIKDRKLYLEYPSTGYNYQIFTKQLVK